VIFQQKRKDNNTVDLRFHGPFPPKVESGIPGTIEMKKPEQAKGQEDDYEPVCLLQAWAEPREGGKIAYLFLMYDLQVPPWEIAQRIVRYFKLNPTHDKHHSFVECTPPNRELLKPIYTRYNFEWEWKKAKWIQRGDSWLWQSSGHGIVFPYSETPITAEEEAQYAQQLEQLVIEAEQQEQQQSKPAALPQREQRLLLPVFSRGSKSNDGGQLAIAEKATQQAVATTATGGGGTA